MKSLPILGLCILLMGQTSASPSSYRFDGRLVRRAGDGRFVSVAPDSILVGWGAGGCRQEEQSPEHIGVYPDATFRLTIGSLFVHAITLDGNDAGIPDVVAWPCYRFQVRGCEDAIVKFGPKPPDETIEIECPGREAPRRVDE